jgi:hypothetical protein
MSISQLTKRLSGPWVLLFPAFAATESRLRSQADDPASSLGQAKRHRLAAPTKDCFRLQGIALALFQRHLSFKRSPFRATQFGGREAQIGDVRRRE